MCPFTKFQVTPLEARTDPKFLQSCKMCILPCLGLLAIAPVFHAFVVIQFDLTIFLFYVLERGVFTTKLFSKGDFLLVYRGELITGDEGSEREDLYNPH